MSDTGDDDFMARRDAARDRLDRLFGSKGGNADDRRTWFEEVYDTAEGDPAAVPWADLKPKETLLDWLSRNPGGGRRALDIACGLGDNAQALADAGYSTTAFDLAQGAVDWAKARFANSPVEFSQADLFSPPADWQGAFDLVHECYTVQALHGELREKSYAAISGFVKPGGTLLVISRSRGEGEEASGPPWPLMPSEFARFEKEGLRLVGENSYEVERTGRIIPHVIAEYRRD
ncbi:methyltransferase domain-containing protein [Stappia sp. GBMRC 2046]|uniref:Methyltransferase domain-containing protein n=1 Tax=Stappia sediminis TaxID=2692190 RepID=A0A7X3S783_9HYPH|nr:class I SAM-dependent methyltransferase [Stappia sediminis]MXN64469.1 methyltransferase domain-containing protein [Stappia sediminis]